jgi:hypothetical protein
MQVEIDLWKIAKASTLQRDLRKISKVNTLQRDLRKIAKASTLQRDQRMIAKFPWQSSLDLYVMLPQYIEIYVVNKLGIFWVGQ